MKCVEVSEPGQFTILTVYGDDPRTYVALCLRCEWQSGKSTTRGALTRLDGPIIAHQRDKHGGVELIDVNGMGDD